MRRILLALPALAALSLLLAGCSWVQSRKRETAAPAVAALPQVGQAAPDLDGEDTTGRRLHLTDYRGQVVLLHFWASW